jgi:hypothetical protein
MNKNEDKLSKEILMLAVNSKEYAQKGHMYSHK